MNLDNPFDCCTNYAGPDFSKMSFKNIDFHLLSHVDWSDGNLWLSIFFICLLPLFRSMMNCCELSCLPFKKCNIWSKIFDAASVSLGILKVVLCWQTVVHQPVWRYLQSDLILFTSYILIGVGGFFITTCACRFGVWDTFFRRNFKIPSPGSPSKTSPRKSTGSSPRKSVCSSPKKSARSHESPAPVPRKYRDLYVVFNFGCFCAFVGFCLMYASQAGLLLMGLQAITYCFFYKGL